MPIVQRLDVADDGQVEVALEHAAQPLRPFDVLDLRVDAHLGQLRGDDLAALARVRRRRQRSSVTFSGVVTPASFSSALAFSGS